MIHRPGWRNTDIPVTHAARIILHRRQRAGRNDFKRLRRIGDARECRRRDLARRRATGEDARCFRYPRLVSMPEELVAASAACEFCKRFRPVLSGHDHLRHHRIVVGRHLAAAFDPSFDAHTGGPCRLLSTSPNSGGNRAPDPRRRRAPGSTRRSGSGNAFPATAHPPPAAPSTRRDRCRLPLPSRHVRPAGAY